MADETSPTGRARKAESPIEAARQPLKQLVRREPQRHPLVIALVAPLGTPLDPVIEKLGEALRAFNYRTELVHLSQLLDEVPHQPWGALPSRGEREYYERRMDAGDQLRTDVGDGSALAALAVGKVAQVRTEEQPPEARDAGTAIVLRSLKHPAEVGLLRHIYGDAFSLVAVASSVEERREALTESLSLFDNPAGEAERLMNRDEYDSSKADFGQRVRDVYSMADVYLPTARGRAVDPEVTRFVRALFGAPFQTPSATEEGMRLAFDASLRSAAPGRQVGAALIPVLGTPVIVGTNEVPKPGGGQYWTGDAPDYRDFQTGTDPNPLYTRRVVQELLEKLAEHGWLKDDLKTLTGAQLLERAVARDDDGKSLLDGARAAALIEFTRCLHAEQAAIVNAARAGVSTDGSVMFTTTFPCHECAKMVVGAGVVTLFYIEPYPKSLVGRLYRDLIDVSPPMVDETGLVGEKLPFRPFVGIAPRRYEAAFVAGKRQEDGDIATFDPLTACPRTGGWSEGTVTQREDVAVSSINRVLTLLVQETGGKATARKRTAASKKKPPSRKARGGQRSVEDHDAGASGTTG